MNETDNILQNQPISNEEILATLRKISYYAHTKKANGGMTIQDRFDMIEDLTSGLISEVRNGKPQAENAS